MVSISQWIQQHLPSDADLGTTPKALDDAAGDLGRLSKQADSSVGAFGYKALGTAFELGRNIGTPFEQTSQDCDRLARQSESTVARFGYSAVGAFFSLSAKAFRLPHDLTMGTADFVADPITVVSSIPEAVQQNGDAMWGGAVAMANGEVASGSSQFLDGAIGDVTLAMVAGGAMHGLPKAYGAYLKGWQVLDQAALRATRGLRPLVPGMSTAQMGAIEVPAGYVRIPGGNFKGQTLPPFDYKATLVTNGEWAAALGGRRFVQLVEDPATLVVRVEDVMEQPPSSVSPKINFDAGEVAAEGPRILVKLVDQPSVVYDARGRVFSRPNQPVVGVNYFHAKAWVLTDASGRLMLPTDLQQEAVASKYGTQKYGTATGELYDAEGRKLGHFNAGGQEGGGATADVNDPRYPAGPYGAYSQFNAWRWMQADPQQTYPHQYGARGAGWNNYSPESLLPPYRRILDPLRRSDGLGFQPVASPGPSQ